MEKFLSTLTSCVVSIFGYSVALISWRWKRLRSFGKLIVVLILVCLADVLVYFLVRFW
mgnify:FL=1|jgi:hypothetical protein